MLKKSEKGEEYPYTEILLHLNTTYMAIMMISKVKWGCDRVAFEIWKGNCVWFKNVLGSSCKFLQEISSLTSEVEVPDLKHWFYSVGRRYP